MRGGRAVAVDARVRSVRRRWTSAGDEAERAGRDVPSLPDNPSSVFRRCGRAARSRSRSDRRRSPTRCCVPAARRRARTRRSVRAAWRRPTSRSRSARAAAPRSLTPSFSDVCGTDLVGDGAPELLTCAGTRIPASFGGTVERHPAHQLGRHIVLRLAGAPQMPWSGSRHTATLHALGLRLDERPESARQTLAAPRVQEDGVEGGAEDVVLALVEGAVASAHGRRASVSAEVGQRRLRTGRAVRRCRT